MGKSKKEVSELESVHGVYQGFFIGIWNIVREQAIPFAAIHRLGTEGGRATLRKMVDLAHGDWRSEQPKPVEPQSGHQYRGCTDVFTYVHMGRDARTDEVLAEMDRKGLQPAFCKELFYFVEKNPIEQRKYPLVALGSGAYSDGDDRGVACLWDVGRQRRLPVGQDGHSWCQDCHFLAKPK